MQNPRRTPSAPTETGLLGTRYPRLAANTIDYWMQPPEPDLTTARVLRAYESAPLHEESTLQLYVHVPFCAQHCRFCAFSGANSLAFSIAERYASLLADQIRYLVARSPARRLPVQSVHIGGGSPDLLGAHIGRVLSTVRDLPGVDDTTEISVEFTLSTTKPDFIEELVRYGVTKVSFGIQTLNPRIREGLRQPRRLHHLPRVLSMIDGRIPVVNADLITCLPGQTLAQALGDLRVLMENPAIQMISSYLLTPGASPSMIAGLLDRTLSPQAPPGEQALMRLHTYTTLLRHGWMRCGTNSYVDPSRVSDRDLARISGNECIGQSHYDAFLIGAGASSVTSVPGARLEQTSALVPWCESVERGEAPLNLETCSLAHQRDAALWVFPLRHEGLPYRRFRRMVEIGALSVSQLRTFRALRDEGLIVKGRAGYQLSLLGEVFMGQLVRDLKKPEGRAVVDEYIAEGRKLGIAVANRELRDENEVNNRQIAESLLDGFL